MTTASTSVEPLDKSNAGPASNFDVVDISSVNKACSYGVGKVAEDSPCDDMEKVSMYSRLDNQLSPNVQGFALETNENKENCGKGDDKKFYPDPRKPSPDRFIGGSKGHSGSISPSQAGSSRVDRMLEDVSECEILWEDLQIGELIGLGTFYDSLPIFSFISCSS
jgi:hypothetical protein